jgi:hypothetical protein
MAFTLPIAGVRDYGIVTALPTNPTPESGDRCVFTDSLVNPTYRWQLVYNAASASAYKWEFVGGNPRFAEVATQEIRASNIYGSLATAGPSVTVPLAGDYDVEIGSTAFGSTGAILLHSYSIGATVASDNDAIEVAVAATATDEICGARVRRKTGLAAGTALVSQYRSTISASNPSWFNRWMRITPVRVG